MTHLILTRVAWALAGIFDAHAKIFDVFYSVNKRKIKIGWNYVQDPNLRLKNKQVTKYYVRLVFNIVSSFSFMRIQKQILRAVEKKLDRFAHSQQLERENKLETRDWRESVSVPVIPDSAYTMRLNAREVWVHKQHLSHEASQNKLLLLFDELRHNQQNDMKQ